jgi:hypothetical protein
VSELFLKSSHPISSLHRSYMRRKTHFLKLSIQTNTSHTNLQPRTHSLKLSKQTNKQTLHTQVHNKNQNPKPFFHHTPTTTTPSSTHHTKHLTSSHKQEGKNPYWKHTPQEFPNTSKSKRERERERERKCKNRDGSWEYEAQNIMNKEKKKATTRIVSWRLMGLKQKTTILLNFVR